ncbi:MAG: basic amino acid ABC transporter substrate-binding protein [Thermoplasmata archaeon]|nr:basic amino acid ABC transporter substrate-binding protein [Euryarchaeota archaeon]RLF65451.1 MAG: basic amino acid ABC transporter substrate-binding protein [Thermoplasmata archaeon]
MKYRWAIPLAVILLLTGLLGCVQKQEEMVLVVGTSADFPPFEYKDPNTGEIVGFDIELIKLIAQRLGYDRVEIKDMDFDSLIPALDAGQIDVAIAGITITEKRKQEVDFSIPYWSADQAVVIRKGSGITINDIKDLYGLTIGVQTGTTGAIFVEENVGQNATIKEYPTYVEALQALITGQIDAIVVDTPVAQRFTQQYDVEIVHVFQTGEQYGIAVKKGNTELLNKINQALQEIMNSNEWNQLIEKYFGSSS